MLIVMCRLYISGIFFSVFFFFQGKNVSICVSRILLVFFRGYVCNYMYLPRVMTTQTRHNLRPVVDCKTTGGDNVEIHMYVHCIASTPEPLNAHACSLLLPLSSHFPTNLSIYVQM